MFPRIKSHSFRGKLYRIFWRRWRRSPDEVEGGNVGRCAHPTEEFSLRTMHIYPKQDPVELLGTVLHESGHACFPDIDDAAMDEFEQSTMRLLRRMGIKVEFHPR